MFKSNVKPGLGNIYFVGLQLYSPARQDSRFEPEVPDHTYTERKQIKPLKSRKRADVQSRLLPRLMHFES